MRILAEDDPDLAARLSCNLVERNSIVESDEDGRLAELRLAIVTAGDDRSKPVELLHAGADDFLAKPFAAEEDADEPRARRA